ncbi:MAG: rhomboid family intramembrane serine protease, partial [Planctomycetales bacterium]|nr:rhomboid family intramembrane serine protease [Planctomycetales bacterium]
MIPIHDTIVGKRMPIVTWTLMGLNALVFLGEVGLPGPQLQTLMQLYGMVPRRFVDPVWAQQHFPNMFYWPFVTSLFLHGSWMHIISNMWTLWIFGDNVEDRMGPARYLIFYLACGVLANLLHLVTNSQSLLPTVGASGAIAGIMGAYIWMFPHSRVVVLVPILFFPFFFEFP